MNGNWMGYISHSLPKDTAHYMVEVMTLRPLASRHLLISAGLARRWVGSSGRLVAAERLRIYGEIFVLCVWVLGAKSSKGACSMADMGSRGGHQAYGRRPSRIEAQQSPLIGLSGVGLEDPMSRAWP